MERKDSFEEDFKTAVALSVPAHYSNGRLSSDSEDKNSSGNSLANDFKTAMVLRVPSQGLSGRDFSSSSSDNKKALADADNSSAAMKSGGIPAIAVNTLDDSDTDDESGSAMQSMGMKSAASSQNSKT
jgi:hypothetical protein